LGIKRKIEIRVARADDLPFLWEMLYEEAAQRFGFDNARISEASESSVIMLAII
jgi:hypothetical protein